MKTNQSVRGFDPYEIDVGDDREIGYLKQQFPWLSREKIRKAVEEHGPDRKTVLNYLDSISQKVKPSST